MSNKKNHNVTHSEEELMDALEKLEETLEEQERQSAASTPDRTVAKSQQKPKPKPQQKPKQDVFLSALEEAAADIDRFMASKHSPSDET
jgi:hypothetical protein